MTPASTTTAITESGGLCQILGAEYRRHSPRAQHVAKLPYQPLACRSVARGERLAKKQRLGPGPSCAPEARRIRVRRASTGIAGCQASECRTARGSGCVCASEEDGRNNRQASSSTVV